MMKCNMKLSTSTGVLRCLVIVAVIVVVQASAVAQLDDLAGNDWALPQVDALYQFHDDPLCLKCSRASDLTAIPGIGRTTASRIVRVMTQGCSTIDELCEKACLTAEQSILVRMCTTMDCDCAATIESVRFRLRYLTNSDAPGTYAHGTDDVLAGADIRTIYGRLGTVVRKNADGLVTGGWLQGKTDWMQITLGELGIASGLGLVHGAGGSFGGSMLSKLKSITLKPTIRPWTSTYQDAALSGLAFQLGQTDASPIQAVAGWSRRRSGSRLETALNAAVMIDADAFSVVLNAQDLSYDESLVTSSSRLIPSQGRQLFSAASQMTLGTMNVAAEIATDSKLATSALLIASHPFSNGEWFGIARWTDPDLRNPYAASMNAASALANEAGLGFAVQVRPRRGLDLEASVDLYSTLSKAYGKPLPAAGIDVIADVEYRPSNTVILRNRLRYNQEDDGWTPPGTAWRRMITNHTTTFRTDVEIKASRTCRLRWRFDGRRVWFTGGRSTEYGYLSYVDLTWQPSDVLRLWFRTTVYDAESMASTAYAFESLMPGLNAIIAGTTRGMRTSIQLRYSLTPWCTLACTAWEQRKNDVLYRYGAGLQVVVHGRNVM